MAGYNAIMISISLTYTSMLAYQRKLGTHYCLSNVIIIKRSAYMHVAVEGL